MAQATPERFTVHPTQTPAQILAEARQVRGFVALRHVPEDDDYRDALTRLSIPYTARTVPGVTTAEAPVELVEYIHPEHGPRAAYLVTSRYDVDAWGQTAFVFARPLALGADALTMLLLGLQHAERAAHEEEHREYAEPRGRAAYEAVLAAGGDEAAAHAARAAAIRAYYAGGPPEGSARRIG